ncbi:hypothetical protein NDU88_007318 [Pleurodeles waltl]|uniref:Uncharacterized protein n=1 Tax=Pleurodeles waltl TaxID=8319 RepID=A0AAV7UNJ0_PLEWA|nr:hypothetical protein NDU88_007318 [Pleurodeles waltl]
MQGDTFRELGGELLGLPRGFLILGGDMKDVMDVQGDRFLGPRVAVGESTLWKFVEALGLVYLMGRNWVVTVQDAKGQECRTSVDIAEAFADYYERLYESMVEYSGRECVELLEDVSLPTLTTEARDELEEEEEATYVDLVEAQEPSLIRPCCHCAKPYIIFTLHLHSGWLCTRKFKLVYHERSTGSYQNALRLCDKLRNVWCWQGRAGYLGSALDVDLRTALQT